MSQLMEIVNKHLEELDPQLRNKFIPVTNNMLSGKMDDNELIFHVHRNLKPEEINLLLDIVEKLKEELTLKKLL